MVPLKDDNPTSTTPVVVYGLVAINILIFLYQMSLLSSGGEAALQQFFNTWAIVPAELTGELTGNALTVDREWLTLFTSQFLHGGFLHLGGNMLYLWIFGNNIEDKLGSAKFLFFYLVCGALAGLAQWVIEPGSAIPTLGASGAIAGVMGAYIIRFPRARILTIVPLFVFITTLRIPALFFLGFWFIQQAFYSALSLGATADMGSGGVAYLAHAGGFVVGVILGPLLGLFKDRGPKDRYRW